MDLTDNCHILDDNTFLLKGVLRNGREEFIKAFQEMCNFYGYEALENNIETV